MGGVNITIVLDSPTNSYYAGTNVTGEVVVSNEKPLDIRGLILKMKGVAVVHWDEEKTETRHQQDGTNREERIHVNYSSEEEYFSNKYNLLGETRIPAGRQSCRFSSPLPPLLPSSFSGEFGSVKYTIKATIDRPWKFDQDASLEFKVVSPLDLNYNPVAKEAVRQEKTKTFCCWCCASGPLVITLGLPQKGFVPTQPIPITLDVENGSNVKIINFEVTVIKTIKWICQKPEKCEKDTSTDIAKVSLEGCPQRESRNLTHNLSLPDMPVTNVEACSVIKITHELKVVGTVGGCHNSPTIKVPLIIGSVPIAGTFTFAGGDPAQFQPPAYSPVQQSSNPETMSFQPGYPAQPAFTGGAPAQPGYPAAPAQPGYPAPMAQPGYPVAPGQPAYTGPPSQPGYPAAPPAQGLAYQPQQPGYPPLPSAPNLDSQNAPPAVGFKPL